MLESNKIIFGVRNFNNKKIPLRSRLGNKITIFTFRVLCGIKISDTQTGLRAFPISTLKQMLEVDGDRFEYENNVIIKIKQDKMKYGEIKISTIYIEDNKSSHFNPVKDSIKIYSAIIKYFISSSISSIVDITLFTILNIIFSNYYNIGISLLLATIIARIISAFLNYYINYKKVFKSNKKHRNTLIKYSLLALIQMLVSYELVYLISLSFSEYTGFQTIIKIVVDILLFFVSYKIQKKVIF